MIRMFCHIYKALLFCPVIIVIPEISFKKEKRKFECAIRKMDELQISGYSTIRNIKIIKI